MTDRYAGLERDAARLLRALQQFQAIEDRRARLIASSDDAGLDALADEAAAMLDDIRALDALVHEQFGRLVTDPRDPVLARLRRLDDMVRDVASRLAEASVDNQQRVHAEMIRMVERFEHLQTGREALRRYQAGADAGGDEPTRDRDQT
ncbi:MAG: hypothetical protein KJ042_04160 [Deltaproteobacteria bacterium]|nr:hypothetical protein [Deltaproteobacteria bacterium]